MGPGGVLLEPMEEEVVEEPEEVAEEPMLRTLQHIYGCPPQGNMGQPEGGMTGWDKRKACFLHQMS